jgi:hypothetical protein
LGNTPSSANVINLTTNRQAPDVDASNLMLLAEVCEKTQMKGLDELILECKKCTVEEKEEKTKQQKLANDC